LRETVKPGPFSMMNIERPRRAGSAAALVLTSTAKQFPSTPLDIQVLVPLMA
jgi:hypothetical protein